VKPVTIFATMPIRKFIVGFFILLFCFQMAPVQQVGSLLYSNQIMEEIPHGQDSGQIKYPDDSLKHFESIHFLSFHRDVSLHSFLTGQAADARVMTRSSDDIQTPPPNHIA
jgi:hypothetical protein